MEEVYTPTDNAHNYNPRYGDVYFSRSGGSRQCDHVFFGGNRLAERVAGVRTVDGGGVREPLVIAELGFGTGLNFATLVQELGPVCSRDVVWYSVDEVWMDRDQRLALLTQDEVLRQDYGLLERIFPDEDSPGGVVPGAGQAGHGPYVRELGPILLGGGGWVEARVVVGDVLELGAILPPVVDAWLLDGHNPSSNSAMWNHGVFAMVARHSGQGSTCATWSAAGLVKQSLRDTGWVVHRKPGFGGKRHCIAAEYGL